MNQSEMSLESTSQTLIF